MLSIIIPCYNVAKTIERTLMSVESQTCSDYEVILVNDGSKDNTLDVINAYAAGKSYVSIIDKPNGGVSSARNAGIKAAKGEYLYFLDGDDTIEPELVQNVQSNKGSDAIIFGYKYDRGSSVTIRIPSIQKDYLRAYLQGNVYIHVCSFAVKMSMVQNNKLYFDENTHYSEDIEFIIKCLICSKTFRVVSSVMFNYMYNPESATHAKSQYTAKNITTVRAFSRIFRLVETCCPKNKDAALVRYQLALISHLGYYYKKHCTDQALLEELKSHTDILKRNSWIYFNKYAIYVQVMRLAYLVNLRLFKKLIDLR